MVKNFINTVLVLLFMQSALAHDFYISVTRGHYNPETQMMECEMKLTAHDVENAIRVIYAEAFDLDDESKAYRHNQLIEKYISTKINIWVNDKFIDLEYIGYEVELTDEMWIYFQFKAPDRTFKYENKVLTELFAMQQNITHFKADLCEKSFVFTKKESAKIFNCDE